MKKTIITGALAAGVLLTSLPADAAPKTNVDKNPTAVLKSLHTKDMKHYQVIQDERDSEGYRHITVQKKLKGIPVEGTELIIHVAPDGSVTTTGNEAGTVTVPKNTVKLTAADAEAAAWQAIGLTESDVSNAGQKALQSVTQQVKNDRYVYTVRISYLEPEAADWHITVDAETGRVIQKQNRLHRATVSGYGYDLQNRRVSLDLLNQYRRNYLYDTNGPASLVTYGYNNATGSADVMSDYDRAFTSLWQKPGVSAQKSAERIVDYYMSAFGYQSYDGQGAEVKSVVHYGTNYNNAFWNGSFLIYGDGDGQRFSPLSGAEDIVAHEFTHAVTDYTAGLNYEGQSGALNESMSDVFATFIDRDYQIGEDAYTPTVAGDALRDLSNPERYGQPSKMSAYRNYPLTEQYDYGGVHVNSGIPNKAYYYISQSIGTDKAAQIYFRALRYYMTPDTDFKAAKEALIYAAADLYGQNEIDAVDHAWNSVEVY